MPYKYVASRYNVEFEEEFDTLDEALEKGWGDSETNEAYPLDIFENGVLLWSNREGAPWKPGTTPLTERINQWGERGE